MRCREWAITGAEEGEEQELRLLMLRSLEGRVPMLLLLWDDVADTSEMAVLVREILEPPYAES